MKKISFSLVIFGMVFLLASCDLFRNDITIHNNSSHTVTFNFTNGNNRNHNLESGKTRTFCSSNGRVRSFSSTPPRVSYRIQGNTGEFFDSPALLLNVRNTLDISIRFSEGHGFMDTSEAIINADEVITVGNIYVPTHRHPRFITEPSARINYLISGDVMFVTIY